MKTLNINLKKIYKSLWLPVMIIPSVGLSLFVLFAVSYGYTGVFASQIASMNIFLLLLIPLISVYFVHSTLDFEYSVISVTKLILCKYISVNIFCFSSVLIPIIIIIILSSIYSVSYILVISYILYIILSFLTQSLMLTAIGFVVAFLLKNKSAYVVSVIISLIFSPFLQNFVNSLNNFFTANSAFAATSNLLNISYDETFRVRFFGAGMPFNSETFLSWAAEVLFGLVILCILLIAKKRTALKNIIIPCAVGTVFTILFVISIYAYYQSAPIIYDYTVRDERAEKSDEYVQDGSTVKVTDYNMELKLGSVLHNKCIIQITDLDSDNITFKLDDCFDITNITVNDNFVNYIRDGSYVSITGLPGSDMTVLFEYIGRLNYEDLLHNKVNYSDCTSSYLSEIFAWYPKILSQSNNIDKRFTIDLTSNNTFVSNLNGNVLMNKGNSKISGTATDIYIFSGYITSVEIDEKNIIIPLEFVNKKSSIEIVQREIDYMTNENASIYTDFLAPYPFADNVNPTDEQIEEWQNSLKATQNEIDAVDTVLYIPMTYNIVGLSYIYGNTYICCESILRGGW